MPKFVTSQNIEIDLELASVGDRILAFIIDGLIQGAYILLMALLALGVDAGQVAIFILCIPLMFYSILFEIFGQGQSPGKKAREIKVVKLDGSAPTLSSYLLRWLFRVLDIYTFYGGVGILSMMISKNTQRLGDLVAGTAVVKVREVGSAQAFKVINEDHKVRFPSVRMLSEDQVFLLRKAIQMYHDHKISDGIVQLSIKLQEKLSIQTDMDHLGFLEAVIEDYDHMAHDY
jgi:uncharacterized RDD family membrane protein YckC